MTADIHQLLDADFNRFFRTKSELMKYYDAQWMPENIPDSAVRIPSVLYMMRLMNTERVVDPATGETRLKETELTKRAKERGRTDSELLKAASLDNPFAVADERDSEALLRNLTELKDYKPGPQRDPYHVSQQKRCGQLQGRGLLDVLRLDIFADFCGNAPVSSLNYVWVTCHIMFLFMEIEDRFRESRHPLWVEAYEHPRPQLRLQKRLALVMAAMDEEDEEALKLFAEVFDKLRLGALSCIFWGDLREESGVKPKRGDEDDIPTDQCSVM